MKTLHTLTKAQAYELFGGSGEAVASALGYSGAATVYNWPATLSPAVSDRVRGAALRLGLLQADSPAPAPAPPVTLTWGTGIIRLMRDGRAV